MIESWQAPVTQEATDADRGAIERTVRDYFEGWYEADPERMTRALHPDLAKRSLGQDADRTDDLSTTAAAEMISLTRDGYGRSRAGQPGSTRITIDHISGGIASVSVASEHYIEYLHLAATADGWRIVNALWRWADGHGPRV